MNMTLTQPVFANALEGFFFGSGKAHVVTGVALIILAGLAISLWRMDRRLRQLESEQHDPKA